MSRRDDLDRLYLLLAEMERGQGGYRYLNQSDGRSAWPERSVYFFFEPGELREDGAHLRVVRAGTHALTATSRTTLWRRLAQHRGQLGGSRAGGGNHRGSIFRLHVGAAILNRGDYSDAVRATWGQGNSAAGAVLDTELELERGVSQFIGRMPFLFVEIPDAPGNTNHRGFVEASMIGLLSNRGKRPIDPPSPRWLGHYADRPAIRESGLWNVNHVDGAHDLAFLDVLEKHIRAH